MNNNFIETYQLLNKFETKENLKLLNSKYGNLWPLFKIEIFKSYNSTYKPLKYKNILWRILGNFKRAITPIIGHKITMTPKSIIKNKDELWLSSIIRRVNGYNKYTDPFFNELSSLNSLMIEKNKNKPLFYKNEYLNKNNHVLNYHSNYNIYNILFFYKNIISYTKVVRIINLRKISEEYPQIPTFNLFICYCYFVNWYNFYKHFFSKFPSLKRIYYTGNGAPDTFAINAAAHALNIETIEFQHGIISKNDINYKYKILTNDILKLIPSKIYVYSSEAKKILESNTKGKVTIKQIENLAFSNWKANENRIVKKNTILLTLQNVVLSQNHFLFAFFKYINRTHPEIGIVLRLHPRHTYIKPKYQAIFERMKISFIWDENSEIFVSLSKAFLNITAFSTSVEDAIHLNVPSWLITKEGKILYEQHIKTNPLVSYINTIEDAILSFEKTLNKSTKY